MLGDWYSGQQRIDPGNLTVQSAFQKVLHIRSGSISGTADGREPPFNPGLGRVLHRHRHEEHHYNQRHQREKGK